jgi:hypothetical protein
VTLQKFLLCQIFLHHHPKRLHVTTNHQFCSINLHTWWHDDDPGAQILCCMFLPNPEMIDVGQI